MKVLLSCLNDYIETGLSAEKTAEILSDLGLPNEGIEHLDGDAVIDLEVTSNRGDCLGLIGIARELSAATGKELKIPSVELAESDKNVTEFAGVQIKEADLCGRYTARVIEGVKIGPSPDWVIKRLRAIGMHSVNNVVDATNYAMFETGQPPHAFDYDKLNDGKIIVRKALPGELIVSIDGSKCELTPDMLIIADAKGPVAIAGVMGGLDTEVSDSTTRILLEDAYFDPVSVRTTSRKLALASESSFRFERTVDIENIDWASKRTARLITQWAGGKVARGVVDIYPKKPKPKQVTLRLSRLKSLLGIDIPSEEVVKILTRLGFAPKLSNDKLRCMIPSWRAGDVYREADLIEEVARVWGYNKVPTENKIMIEVTPVDPRQKIIRLIEGYLNGCGFYETVCVGFIDKSAAELFAGPARPYLAVKDISRKSTNLLRQSLLPSLFSVMKTNFNANNRPCRIFELAETFRATDKTGDLPVEKTKLALACDSDLRELRGVIEGLVRSIDRDAKIDFAPTELVWARAGAQIIVNQKPIGTAAVISDKVKKHFDFKDAEPVGCELNFEALEALQRGPIKVKPISRFPAIQRDLAIVVDEAITWSDISRAVNDKASAQLEDVRFVEIYRGKGIPASKKSVTLSLTFRDRDGTLTHEIVDHLQEAIVKCLSDSVGAELRTI